MAENDRDSSPDDLANPYAPPEVEPARPKPVGPYAVPPEVEPFSASLVIGRSWEIYKQRFGVVLAVVLGNLALNAAYQIVGSEMQEGVDLESAMARVGRVAFFIAGSVLQYWLTCGQTIALLRVARGEPATFGDLFQGWPYLLRYIGATVAFSLLLLAVMAAFFAPALVLSLLNGREAGNAVPIAVFLGFLACLAPVLYLTVRFYQYPYLIVDRDAGPIEALRESFRLTRGNAFELTGLMFITGVVGMSGILACGFGLLLTIPLSMLMFACTYVALTTGLPRHFYLETGEIGDDL